MMVETKQDETRTRVKGPVRMCAGCAKRASADELVRVVLDPSSGELAVDLAGSGFGRGAHVHPSPDCLAKAQKGGFAKVLKAKVDVTIEALGAAIVDAVDRRIEGLIGGARRGKHVAMGSDAVREAVREGTAALVVVACDAAAAAALPEVQRAVSDGKAIAWSNKARLGSLFAREEVAVCAVQHAGVAAAIASAHRTSGPFRSEAWSCPEVR